MLLGQLSGERVTFIKNKIKKYINVNKINLLLWINIPVTDTQLKAANTIKKVKMKYFIVKFRFQITK